MAIQSNPIVLVYSIICSLVVLWTLVVPPVNCDDGDVIKYDPEGCNNAAAPSCPDGKGHTFSEPFFRKCAERMQTYVVALRPSPFNPKQICLLLPRLNDKELCISFSEHGPAITALLVFLLIILILDIIGVGFIIFMTVRDCFKPKQPPPPPPVQQTPQPTIVVIQA